MQPNTTKLFMIACLINYIEHVEEMDKVVESTALYYSRLNFSNFAIFSLI